MKEIQLKIRKMKRNKSDGITLIALVVTIIVLLILAGISISVLSGDNGILQRAAEARNQTAVKSLKEQAQMVITAREINNNTRTTNKPLKEQLEDEIKNAEIEEIPIADGENKYKDVYYVKSGTDYVTVYEDGDVQEGKLEIWDGTISCPEFKQNGSIWDWYIYTPSQLKFLADFVNNGNSITGSVRDLTSYVKSEDAEVTMSADTMIYLMNNIDLGARPGEESTGETKWVTNPEKLKWTPIGTDASNVTDKLGTFEGNNYSIKGVYVNRAEDYNGLFGNSNKIQNLTIKDSFIQGKSETGGIVGDAYESIENCHNRNTTISILEEDYIYNGGGIVSMIYSICSISNCSNNGKIIGKQCNNVGGIIGYAPATITINGCNNSSNKIIGKNNVGGVIGHLQGVITNCNNFGEIEGIQAVGGIIGWNRSTHEVRDCTNKGSVEGTNDVGGIVGNTYNSTKISACNNSGTIRTITGAGYDVGGIAGTMYFSSSMSDCNNSGTISGAGYVGGIAGTMYFSSSISKCNNNGTITGTESYTGGVIGLIPNDGKDPSDAEPATVSECYNTGKIKGKKDTGGIMGTVAQYGSLVEKCYNLGEIEGTDVYTGGIAGRLGRSSKIWNCYNVKQVKGTTSVGGIAGYTYLSKCEIKNCYNVGMVNGNDKIGGILGENSNSSEIINSYYLDGTASLDIGTGTTSDLKKDKTYITTTFVETANAGGTIWQVDSEKNEGWPVLTK